MEVQGEYIKRSDAIEAFQREREADNAGRKLGVL